MRSWMLKLVAVGVSVEHQVEDDDDRAGVFIAPAPHGDSQVASFELGLLTVV